MRLLETWLQTKFHDNPARLWSKMGSGSYYLADEDLRKQKVTFPHARALVCVMNEARAKKLSRNFPSSAAFDGNPAGHVIAMLYKFGAENRDREEFQESDMRELSAPNLKVVALFPSYLQSEGCPLWQTPFNVRDTQLAVSSIQRLQRLETSFNDAGNDVLAAECDVWVQEMQLWQNEHGFTAELDSLTRIYSWDTVILFWLGAEQQLKVEGS